MNFSLAAVVDYHGRGVVDCRLPVVWCSRSLTLSRWADEIMFRELDVVVVRSVSDANQSFLGTQGVERQPVPGDEGTIVNVLTSSRFTVECLQWGSPYTAWLADFDARDLAPAPPNWSFQVSEVSPGAYQATGDGPRGMRVESTKETPDLALADCRAFAIRYPE